MNRRDTERLGIVFALIAGAVLCLAGSYKALMLDGGGQCHQSCTYLEQIKFGNVLGLQTSAIAEYTTDSGVTIDGVLLKDGSISATITATQVTADGIYSTGTIGAAGAMTTGSSLTAAGDVTGTHIYGNGYALTGLTSTQVGLGSVENTALSTWHGTENLTVAGALAASSLNSSGDVTGTNLYGNGYALTGLTSTQVGLGSVENTALSTWHGTENLSVAGALATSSLTSTGELTGTAVNTALVSLDGFSGVQMGAIGEGYITVTQTCHTLTGLGTITQIEGGDDGDILMLYHSGDGAGNYIDFESGGNLDIVTNVSRIGAPDGGTKVYFLTLIHQSGTWRICAASNFAPPAAGELGDLSNVTLASPTHGQVLAYSSTDAAWENTTIASGGAVSDVDWNGSNWTSTVTAPSMRATAAALTRGEWELVERKTVSGSAETTLTFSGLDGNTAIRYKLNCRFITAGLNNYYGAFFNGDRNEGNYYRALGSTAGTGAGVILTESHTTSGLVATGYTEIWASSGGQRTWVTHYNRMASATAMAANYAFGGFWVNTADNITQIDVVGLGGADININSVVELWRLAP